MAHAELGGAEVAGGDVVQIVHGEQPAGGRPEDALPVLEKGDTRAPHRNVDGSRLPTWSGTASVCSFGAVACGQRGSGGDHAAKGIGAGGRRVDASDEAAGHGRAPRYDVLTQLLDDGREIQCGLPSAAYRQAQ